MAIDDPPADLLSALESLKIVARELKQEIEQPSSRRNSPLERLRVAINTLGQIKPARRVVVPQDYLRQWQEFLAGERERLEPRAVRYLCWEPEVATNERFQDYLDREHTDLSARSLQGLVRSCHARWSSTFATGPVAAKVRRRLRSYQGANRFLSRWKDALPLILGSRGAEDFADDMVKNLHPIKSHCDAWGIEEQSSYIQQAVQHAALRSRERLAQDIRLSHYLLKEILSWTVWSIEKFKAEVSAAILHPVTSEAFRESLIAFVSQDHRLGDPRLPRNRPNWLGVADEARRRLIEWLSRADINFFFEHCLPRGADPHGRKPFWLRYVSRVAMSRPLLDWEDKARLQAVLRQSRDQVGHFGLIEGTTSAFLLDFGPVVVIEFSRAGNACHIYEKRVSEKVVPDFWTVQPFTIYRLKQRSLCVERVVHRIGWQQEMTSILARYGIRPV